jgi:hypothetical protein
MDNRTPTMTVNPFDFSVALEGSMEFDLDFEDCCEGGYDDFMNEAMGQDSGDKLPSTRHKKILFVTNWEDAFETVPNFAIDPSTASSLEKVQYSHRRTLSVDDELREIEQAMETATFDDFFCDQGQCRTSSDASSLVKGVENLVHTSCHGQREESTWNDAKKTSKRHTDESEEDIPDAPQRQRKSRDDRGSILKESSEAASFEMMLLDDQGLSYRLLS